MAVGTSETMTDEQTDNDRGKHQSNGFPGKLTAAQNHAPEGATGTDIQDVAREAFERGVTAERVWRERLHSDLTSY
jgi:hypothetical protein